MNFSASNKTLDHALAIANRFVERKHTIPALTHLLIEAAAGSVCISGTDLEIGVQCIVKDATVTAEGKTLLPAARIGTLVHQLDDGPVSISQEPHPADALLKSGRAKYKLTTMAPDDYPSIQAPQTGPHLRFKSTELVDAIDQVVYAVSHDESRYALNGVLVRYEEEGHRLVFVATDGHRMAMTHLNIGAPVTVNAIIPRRAIEEVRKLLTKDADKTAVVGFTSVGDAEPGTVQNLFTFRSNGTTVTARLIEGTFPSYQQVIPENHPITLTFDRQRLDDAVRRVSKMSEERTRPIRLDISPDQVRFSAQSPDFGEAEEILGADAVKIEGPLPEPSGTPEESEEAPIRRASLVGPFLGLNSNYLKDAIDALESATLTVSYKDNLSPIIIKGDGPALCVVMPMRL